MFKWKDLFRNTTVTEPASNSSHVIVPIFSEDVVLGTITDRELGDLRDEEIKTLWFVLDKYLDTEMLGELYCEMKKRNLHVLLPSELAERENEIAHNVMKFNGVKAPATQKWAPDNARYESQL